jgi:protein ImuB
MYVCLHVPLNAGGPLKKDALLALALDFSPKVERVSDDTVVFSILPLQKLFGTSYQLASEIARYGYERDVTANLAIASNPDTAILLARTYSGVTFVASGCESEKLGPVLLTQLVEHTSADPSILETLERWGLRSCGDVAALPEKGLVERFGIAGLHLRNLALGRVNRPLFITIEETKYQEKVELDYSIQTLEPLLFLLSRALGEMCGRLRSQFRAARLLHLKLFLSHQLDETETRTPEAGNQYECELEFPVPLSDSHAILKVLQLYLEHNGPRSSVSGFNLQLSPVAPKRVQNGLFLPPTPAPDKLQITLARIAGIVGEENVGSPELLNTHRPDAFRLRPLVLRENPRFQSSVPPGLKLAMRIFRPALYARVRLADQRPKQVVASGVEGEVIEAAGPWRTSGDWWTDLPWARDEWDVELNNGGLYRIYCESKTKDWYVQAMYD